MNVQVIMQDGRPAFAVMPFAQYEQLLKKAEMTENQADKLTFPQEVIDYKYDNNCSFIKAWRVYLKKHKRSCGGFRNYAKRLQSNRKC